MSSIDASVMRANALFCDGRYAEAFRIYEAGMQAGHTRAIFNFAYCLQYGYGTVADPERAFKIYGFLRYEEEGDAAYNAAAMLLTGRGVPCDLRRGYAMMVNAAEHGCIEAQLYVAMARLTGCVGEPDAISIRRIPFHKPDPHEHILLLPPVAGEDGEYADENLDLRFEIVEADEYEAIHYIREAVRNDGDYTGVALGYAEFLLGKCAEEGLGRMFDRDRAIELYVRAAEHGSIDAHRKLQSLPPADVDSARRRLALKSGSPDRSARRIGNVGGRRDEED